MVQYDGDNEDRNYPFHPAVTRVLPSHNGAVVISVLYDQDEVYRGENDINSKISVWKGQYKQEVYRGEKNKESRIVVKKGSIRFKNHSAEFQDELFPDEGFSKGVFGL